MLTEVCTIWVLSHYWAALQYYVDAANCYRWSSVVCLSVCHDCEPYKNG